MKGGGAVAGLTIGNLNADRELGKNNFRRGKSQWQRNIGKCMRNSRKEGLSDENIS